MSQVRRASRSGRHKAEADASAFGTATVRERRALHEPNPPSRGPRSTVTVVVWAIDAWRLAAGLSRGSMRMIETRRSLTVAVLKPSALRAPTPCHTTSVQVGRRVTY